MPRQQRPDLIANEYRKAMLPFLARAHELVTEDVLGPVREMLQEKERRAERARVRLDAFSVSVAFDAVARQLFANIKPGAIETLARTFGNRTADFQKVQLQRQVRAALGVDMTMLEPNIDTLVKGFVNDGVSLIKSLPTEYLGDVETRVNLAVRTGTRWESLSEDLAERYDIAENRADLIARDQVGKLYGKVNETRQAALGVTGYTWRGVNDEREREEHQEREGEHFEWDDPPEDGHPGEPILCRCYAEPDFSDLFEDATAIENGPEDG